MSKPTTDLAMTPSVKPLPFQIVPNDGRSMIDQMTAGIATAVRSGYYRAGDRLPTLHKMSAQLGVSLAVPRRAVTRLAGEGLLRSARRRGIVVCAPGAPGFRGQVLFLTPDTPGSFYFATRDWAFHEALADEGIRLTTIHWGGERTDHALALLHQALDSGPVGLAVQENAPWGGEALDARGVARLLAFPADTSSAAEPAALFLDGQVPARRVARHLRSCGVRSVGLSHGVYNDSLRAAARAAGLTVVPLAARVPRQAAQPACVRAEADGYALGLRLARLAAAKRPDAVCLSDDYLARGVLAALQQQGVRVPEEIQLAAVLNVGHFPVIGRPITRIEMDPVRDGRAMADLVLRRLRADKRAFKPVTLVPRFRVGDTTRRR